MALELFRFHSRRTYVKELWFNTSIQNLQNGGLWIN